MPELSRFYGIIIRMYSEAGPHHVPHFHAYYGDDEAVFRLAPIELLAAAWDQLEAGNEPLPIDPLQQGTI